MKKKSVRGQIVITLVFIVICLSVFIPFMLLVSASFSNEKDVINIYNSLDQYFPSWVGYNMAKCGGCIRACVSILEKKGGCLEGKFKNPLRTQKAWKMDR